jgi:hypothetical protein
MIICQYLFAEFSLKSGPDKGLSAEQTEAVDRWRKRQVQHLLDGDPADRL